MDNIVICILCGEEIEESLFYKYSEENSEICSNCDREMFEDSIGYEEN